MNVIRPTVAIQECGPPAAEAGTRARSCSGRDGPDPVVTGGIVFSEVGVGVVLRTQQHERDTPDVLFLL